MKHWQPVIVITLHGTPDAHLNAKWSRSIIWLSLAQSIRIKYTWCTIIVCRVFKGAVCF